jgi:hypothetical protein
MIHVQSGLRMLAEIVGEVTPDPSFSNTVVTPKYPLVPYDMLAVLFTRLDIQVVQLQSNPAPPICIARKFQVSAGCFCPAIPDAFTSIDEARNSFDYTWSDIAYFLEENGLARIENAGTASIIYPQILSSRLSRWCGAFSTFIHNPATKLSSKEQKAAKLLRLYSIIGEIAIMSVELSCQLAYDRYTHVFAVALQLAEEILSQSDDNTDFYAGNERWKKPKFQFDTGIVLGVFEIIWKCRDSKIRRKAISLLLRYPRREGLSDSALVARLGQEIMRVEQGDYETDLLCEDIPEYCRVSEVGIELEGEEPRGTLVLGRAKSAIDSTRVRIRRPIEW